MDPTVARLETRPCERLGGYAAYGHIGSTLHVAHRARREDAFCAMIETLVEAGADEIVLDDPDLRRPAK